MKKLHPVMFAGTGSDVGKSVLATAMCRILLQDGYHPAPFKAQNMALNSYATPDGLEIGRAQAVQAEAAGLPCSTDMNPLLLKPGSDMTSQVILNGKVLGNRSASQYFSKKGIDSLREAVNSAFDRLYSQYNPIIMEGAGSISELNLRETDLVNLPMARHAGADIILVADIDRGGVFASVYGSLALQTEADRRMFKGIIINKFRGDIGLFREGAHMLENICKIPVLGVIPYFNDIHIEAEDSLILSEKQLTAVNNKVNIAVILLRHMSNFTDFNLLEMDERVNLFYTNNTDEIGKADIIILPGSKSTIDDLQELRKNGVARAVLAARHRNATIFGICGGYQMMGRMITDPDGIEGSVESMPGLGLLPTVTTMSGDKTTRQVTFCFKGNNSAGCSGYEIHMGRTVPDEGYDEQPLSVMEDGRTDGYVADEKCFGTYIHGILDNQEIINWLVGKYTDRISASESSDYQSYKEKQYDLLADHVRKHLDMEKLYKIMKGSV